LFIMWNSGTTLWDVWIPVTVAAAALQVLRTALQHRLRALLSVSGAGFVRYLYGAPLSLAAVAVCWLAGVPMPGIEARFWPTIAAAGAAQILGTMFLIRAFDARDFAVGTVLSKTEVVQVALFSLVLLGEPLRVGGWIGAIVCTAGVVGLASRGARLRATSFTEPAARFGLAAGGMLGLAAIGIRAATRALDDASPAAFRALIGLAVMNAMQTVLHGAYIAMRPAERGQVRLVVRHWRSSAVVGVLSVTGSACWAIALALENAAKVRTLGQIELLFAFAVSTWWLKDRHTRGEYVASALVVAGVVGVMVAG
jgi:drug/metabolite transporter (DMT)-like permease